jgi:hypothetical protein
MKLTETPSALKQFHKTVWRFQRTFKTPLKNLQKFVVTIVTAFQPVNGASLIVEQVVFEPKHLNQLLSSYSISPKHEYGLTLIATDRLEVDALLLAAFSDSLDFVFIPDPKPFVIYADHDEYTTFFAHTRSNLNRAVSVLTDQGFALVSDYERRL